MQFTGNLPSARRLNRRHLAKDEAPGPSTNLVLINPRTGSAGAHTHAEFPDDFTRHQLDNEMYALTFGMWF